MMTIEDIARNLRLYDTTQILEALDINEEELIERFRDKLEERQDYLRGELEE